MGIRRDGREPDDLRPITFTRDFTEFAAGLGARRVRPDPRAVHRVGRGAGAAVAARQGPGLGHRRVLDAARARPPERIDREAAQGKQSGRTQEIQRLIGRSLRAVTDLDDDGRGADHRRLRRAAGRRRHAHRVDLRRLRRAARRVLAARRGQDAWRRTRSPTRARAISVGIVDALAVPRPRLLRGRARRGRHERGDDRRRALRRGAGHRRGRCRSRAASSTTCSASPRRASREIFDLQREVLAEPPPRRQ